MLEQPDTVKIYDKGFWKRAAKFYWNEARGWRLYAMDLEKRPEYTLTMEQIDVFRTLANNMLDIFRYQSDSVPSKQAKLLYDELLLWINEALIVYRREHGL